MARLSFRCSEELVAAVDVARGDVARERWLRRAVEQALGEAGSKPGVLASSGSSGDLTSSAASSPAPAEQPEWTGLDLGPMEPDRERSSLVGSSRPYRQHVPGPNVENIRSSSQREFRPYPKGGK